MTKNIFLNLTKKLIVLSALSVSFFITAPQQTSACLGNVIVNGTSSGIDVCAELTLAEEIATAGSSGVSATANTATASASAAGAASSAATQVTNLAGYSWDTVLKNSLDAAAYTMAQKLLTKLTDNTVAWIRGGFRGSPNFNVDVEATALEVADEAIGGFVLSLRNLSVCEFTANYKDDLIRSVQRSAKERPLTYQQKAVCPFNQNYSFKASDFYADFNNGGWNMMSGALSDGGNPYGVQMLTSQEKTAREAESLAISNQKLSWSNGFKDIVDTENCVYPPEVFPKAGDNSNRITEDGIAEPMTAAEAQAEKDRLWSDPAQVRKWQEKYCKTTTPGKIVGDQLTKTLGVNMDRIGFADNMNKIVAAFISTAMEEAVRGVFGKGNRSTAGGGVTTTGGTTPTYQAPTLSVLTANNVTRTTADLTGTLLYSGSSTTRLRVWFVVKNADSTIPWARSYEVIPISPKPEMQSISLTALGLPAGNTYQVTALYTTGGPTLIAPSVTSSVINGVVTTRTNPGNGILGNGSFTFSTLP